MHVEYSKGSSVPATSLAAVQVTDVLFAEPLKYLLIVCGNTRQELEDLQPAISEAEACSTDGELVGVIVSLVDGMVLCLLQSTIFLIVSRCGH